MGIIADCRAHCGLSCALRICAAEVDEHAVAEVRVAAAGSAAAAAAAAAMVVVAAAVTHLDHLGGHEVGVAHDAVEELLESNAAAFDKVLLEARPEEIHGRLVRKCGDEVAGKMLGQL